MNLFQILDIDSEIFGFPVAKILPAKLGRRELGQVIDILRREGVRLAFWSSDPEDAESQRAARLFQGFLSDKKVTYIADTAGNPAAAPDIDGDIEAYTDTLPCPELESLACQIGKNSRFGADPRIPETVCFAMYRRWIRNSVNRQLADAVLVVRQAYKIVGMVTLGKKNGRGDIGLFAVDPAMRRKNLGISLVHAAGEWTRRKGLRYAQVVTQRKNVAACRLYEKCGYRMEKMEFFYHFWL